MAIQPLPAHVETQLVNFNSKTQFCAIDRKDPNAPKFVVLNRKDFSCWQFFLKIIFGCGKLRKFDIRLIKVTQFLSQFDFSTIKQAAAQETADTNSNTYKAYISACRLANKATRKGYYDLFFKVSAETTMRAFVHTYDYATDRITPSNETIRIYWNPNITTPVLAKTIAIVNRFIYPYYPEGHKFPVDALPYNNYSNIRDVQNTIGNFHRFINSKRNIN